MKVLFIGGTGIISTAVTPLAAARGIDLYLLNRGTTPANLPPGVKVIHADIRNETQARAALADHKFDVVVNWVVYTVPELELDFRLFGGRVGQYIFISSASAYQKPPANHRVTESTPLANPWWEYSRNKIACEERLIAEYRASGFPAVIVRPSLTYGNTKIPLTINRWNQSWSAVDRMLKGKPIIIHGDGNNVWVNTHNSDFAKAFVPLMGDVRVLGHAVHITSDEVLTWNQCYQIVADHVGVKPKFVHVASETLAQFDPELKGCLLGDWSHSVIFDNSKIKSLVPDYAATTTFKEGMRQTIAHFRANPSLQTVDPTFDPWCDRVIAAVQKIAPI